ncbi:transposable element Tcb2 transposase [Trichonephila clavipes]|nr:transposable element Tcb2 transposase [Trichonephila clavipes]
MVWCAIVYHTRSHLELIRGTMTAQWYVHDILQPPMLPLMQRLPRALFNKTILDLTWQECHKTVSAILLSFLGLHDPSFVYNRAYLGSFGTASRASHEFE